MNNQTTQEGKNYAIVAYITIIGVLIAYFMTQDNKNSFTTFHIRQSLGLWLIYFILGYIVGGFDSWIITYSFWIFFLVLFAYGIIGAATGKLNKLPLIGNVFQNVFKSIQ
ncbi:hypothetical protein ACFQ1Q_00780 [Winogradskyella litorisediminis]|uniref:Chloroplast import component protein (Tic20) n=1 Tax=Winogradskyella litorisediminis TaxID=1156618 RepID=A0ABW3N5M6_9FLAO